MHRISSVHAHPGHKLTVRFSDGLCGTIDLSQELIGPVFGPLADEAVFHRVVLDAYGVPTWPNGADIAPDALYEDVLRQSGREG